MLNVQKNSYKIALNISKYTNLKFWKSYKNRIFLYTIQCFMKYNQEKLIGNKSIKLKTSITKFKFLQNKKLLSFSKF